MATTPDRAISVFPNARIRATKASILLESPLRVKTKDLRVASETLAANILANRRASLRSAPLATILTRAISFSICSPCIVRSSTLCTGTSLASCAFICSIVIASPDVTIVMRETVSASFMEHTVRLSILYPLPENSPITLDRTPASLSTIAAIACRLSSSDRGITE